MEGAGSDDDNFSLDGPEWHVDDQFDDFTADAEGPGPYSLVIVASSTGTDRPTMYARLPVTVKVVDS